MISDVRPGGGGFRGLLNYLTDEEKLAERVGGNMLGVDARSLAHEFAESRSMNERVKKPVFHASLSLHPDDKLTAQDWERVATSYVEQMGYGNSQWVAFRHRDRAHDHIHIVASRIDFAGTRVNDYQDRARSEEVVRGLRSGLNLREVPRSRDVKDRRISRGQAEQFIRTGEVTPKVAIRAAISEASKREPTMQEFAQRLARRGVEMVPRIQSTGRVSGVSFRLGEVELPGSKLGRPYSWGNLQKVHGVRYEESRDFDHLRDLASRPSVAEQLTSADRDLERLSEQRRALPLDGDFDTIRLDLLKSRSVTESVYKVPVLHEMYRDPIEAARSIAAAIERDGPRAVRELRDRPETFGQLHGHGLAGLETAARQAARSRAPTVAQAVGAERQRVETLRRALPTAEEFQKVYRATLGARQGAIVVQAAAGRLTRVVSKNLGRAASKALDKGVSMAVGAIVPPPVKAVLAVGRVAAKVVRKGLELDRGRGHGR